MIIDTQVHQIYITDDWCAQASNKHTLEFSQLLLKSVFKLNTFSGIQLTELNSTIYSITNEK